MSVQRRADTEPEMQLRRRLHAMGLRYRLQANVLGGRRGAVDIAFPRDRVAVEVRGCFWHCCPAHATYPKSNADWWSAKLARNVERDANLARRLEDAGWTLVVVWEHEDPDVAARRVARVVRSGRRRRTGQ